MHTVKILWGDSMHSLGEYDFKTATEKEAFLYGADEANGWMSYSVLDDSVDVAAVLKKIEAGEIDPDDLDAETLEHGCRDCGGTGWDYYNVSEALPNGEVQRCDTCKKYATDEDAASAAAAEEEG